jgi:hypothetical protein
VDSIENQLIPKIPLDPKQFDCCLDMMWRKKSFLIFFVFDNWTIYFTSILATPNMWNSNSIWAHGALLFVVQNGLWIHVSCIIWRAPIYCHMAKTVQGLKDRVPKKKCFLPIESWIFNSFFSVSIFAWDSTWCHLQYDCSDLNVKFLIFLKKFYNSKSVGILSPNLVIKKDFSHPCLQI